MQRHLAPGIRLLPTRTGPWRPGRSCWGWASSHAVRGQRHWPAGHSSPVPSGDALPSPSPRHDSGGFGPVVTRPLQVGGALLCVMTCGATCLRSVTDFLDQTPGFLPGE